MRIESPCLISDTNGRIQTAYVNTLPSGFQSNRAVTQVSSCACGCGEAPKPGNRFVRFHQNRGALRGAVDPNPSGVCMCGCGVAVGLAAASRSGVLKTATHVRFLPGHHARKAPVDYVAQDCGYETPCWVWQRKVTSRGYGIVEANAGRPRAQHAHRFVWEREVGPLDDALELHHLCENRACVNPAHLEPVDGSMHRTMHAKAVA